MVSFVYRVLFSFLPAVLAFSPTGGYSPGDVSCPSSDSLVREATTISDDESDWLDKRRAVANTYLRDFLDRADLGIDLDSYFDETNITIGLAFSGGGYRAMLAGAGEVSALDDRTVGATENGLGGLLQSSIYLAGLSGGNWLTCTLALNNWTSVQDIIDQDEIWNLKHSIINAGGWSIAKTIERWNDIVDAIDDKKDAGYDTTITDLWGRALSYQMFGSSNDGSVGLTFSSIRNFDHFKNGSMPFPISVADGRTPGTTVVNENSTVFEFNPFEMGSWDPSLNAFTDLWYLGTNVSNGSPVDDTCVAGYDNGGFVLGTSSSLFNKIAESLNTTSLPSIAQDLIESFLNELGEDYEDIAIYEPNPFYKTTYGSSDKILNDRTLYLVDGGEDLQNVPLAPLIQKPRDVDVIFAFDNSADINNFPEGISLVETYERQFSTQGNTSAFPYVPGPDTFIELGLTERPTFFGCNASNLTDLAFIPPLVVYIANAKYSFASNTSTTKLSYSEEEKLGMIKNGFEVASRNNLTDDSSWQKCVSCAVIRRFEESNNIQQTDECEQCFSDYCWDGAYVLGDDVVYPNGTTIPTSSLSSSSSSSTSSSSGSGSTGAASNIKPPTTTLCIASLMIVLTLSMI